jgi:hypothetical protein
VGLADIFAGLQLTAAPTIEPLNLDDAKTHLRVTADFDDPYIEGLITFARQEVEKTMRRALLSQQWMLSLKNWPGRNYGGSSYGAAYDASGSEWNHIRIPLPPLASVQYVNYYDTSGNLFTMPQGAQIPSSPPSGNAATPGSYNVFTAYEPGRIVLPFSQIWPTTILLPGAPIQIGYTCGYPDLQTLQSLFEGFSASIHAMKMIIGYLYENRVPPTEMRKSLEPAGIQLVVEEILYAYRVSA